jgi:hypothetical protein
MATYNKVALNNTQNAVYEAVDRLDRLVTALYQAAEANLIVDQIHLEAALQGIAEDLRPFLPEEDVFAQDDTQAFDEPLTTDQLIDECARLANGQ